MRGLALVAGLLWAMPAAAVTCSNVTYQGVSYSTCEVDPATEDLRLFRADAAGSPYLNFQGYEQATGETLGFAMNAGMFHDDLSPVGYYVQNGQQHMRLVTNPGPGNFGLLPNGLLCLRTGAAFVFETLTFEAQATGCDSATQSGPMLVIDGNLHPKFLADSTSRYIRNGVGATLQGDRVVFAISNQPVTFYEFGTFYRDYLKLPNALYFDGNVSRLHAPPLGRSDAGFPMGPMVGVIE